MTFIDLKNTAGRPVVQLDQAFTSRRETRRGGAAVDFFFYHARATALRRQALRDSAALRRAVIVIVLVVFILPFLAAGTAAVHRIGTQESVSRSLPNAADDTLPVSNLDE